ncbi:hypothetical protein M5689_022464 [Euphorbia peplus]|nr:hypothetical protein M5689_022464 [Euphorbia peplus]
MEETLLNHSAASGQNGDNEIELLIVPDKEPERERLWSLKERIKKAPELLNSRAAQESCSIIRVPQNMMELYPKSFQPGIISIGPYYHGDKRFRMMEEQKCRILGAFLDNIREFCVDLDQLYQPIKEKEEEIRDCYSQNIDRYSSCELIEMMILDGCFIIHLLCFWGKVFIPEVDDPIFNFPWMLSSLTRDFLLLDNQIPFFVLQTLYSLCLGDHLEVPSLQELILTLINYSFPRPNSSVLCDKYRNIDCKHILDFYRSTCIPSLGIDNQEKTLWSCCWWPWWSFLSSSGKEKATDQQRGTSLRSLPKEDTKNDMGSLLSPSPSPSPSPKKETIDGSNSLESLSENVVETVDLESNILQGERSTDLEDWSDKYEEIRKGSVEPLPEGGIFQFKKWVKYLCGLDGIQLKAKSSVQFIQPVETLLHAGIKFKKREDTIIHIL